MTRDPTSNYMFVMKYRESDDLHSYLDEVQGILPWKVIVEMLWEIFGGINYFHENGLIHGNLHGGNVLVENGASHMNFHNWPNIIRVKVAKDVVVLRHYGLTIAKKNMMVRPLDVRQGVKKVK